MKSQRFIDLTARMIYLRSIPVTSLLPTSVLKIVAAHFQERMFEPGEPMMRQGQPIRGLHLLTTGAITLLRDGRLFGTLAPPQSLGFLAILARQPGTYDVTAEVPTWTLELSSELLIEFLEDYSEFLFGTVRYLAQRLTYELQGMNQHALGRRLDGREERMPEGRELDLVERVVWLRSLSQFKHTNLNALASMARGMVESRVASGTRLWSRGDQSDSMQLIVSGRASCTANDGRTWAAGPTSVLGGMESLGMMQRWYDITADGPLIVLTNPIVAFLALLEDDWSLASDVVTRFASDLMELLERNVLDGRSTLNVPRDVTSLGPVLVGA